MGLSHPGSTESDVAVCRSPHAHTHTHEHRRHDTCVSQSKQQLFASKSASLESGSKAVFGRNHIDRVSSTTGAVRRGTLCLSFFFLSLSHSLCFSTKSVSVTLSDVCQYLIALMAEDGRTERRSEMAI